MNFRLHVVKGQSIQEALAFPEGEFLIGRGIECHIRPNSPMVSRQHCLLRITEQEIFLQDLGSTNGTMINGERLIGERELFDGDMLQVGPVVFAIKTEGSSILDLRVARETLHDQVGTLGEVPSLPEPIKSTTVIPSVDRETEAARR